MRKYFMMFGVVAALGLGALKSGAGTDEVLTHTDGDLIAHVHFAGTKSITSSPLATKLNEFAAMPETAALRDKTLDKLSTAPFRLLHQKLATGVTNEYSELLRPLFEDLLKEEFYLEMRGPTNAMPELMLAVHMDSIRAKTWQDSLAMVVSTWTGIATREIRGDGFTGWELKKHHDPNLIRCLRAGDWVLFGWGENELKLQPGFLQRIKQNKRPVAAFKDDWLDVFADWPTIMRYHPLSLPTPLPPTLPKMHLTVQTGKDYVRPKLVMQYPEPLNLKLDPWRIPTHLVRGTPASFTAMRGVGNYLSQLKFIQEIQPPNAPNQLFFWSILKVPFENYVVAPVSGASNYMAKIGPNLETALNAEISKTPIPAQALWTNGRVYLANMPFVSPFLQPVREPAGEFILGGLFPSTSPTNAPSFSGALLKEIQSKPGLVYYSWEIGEERIPAWQGLIQIYLLFTKKAAPYGTTPGLKWLTTAEPKLGNCFTEINQTALDELTLVRNSPLGLSALEMDLLEFWMDSPGFPIDIGYPRQTRRHAVPPPAPGK